MNNDSTPEDHSGVFLYRAVDRRVWRTRASGNGCPDGRLYLTDALIQLTGFGTV